MTVLLEASALLGACSQFFESIRELDTFTVELEAQCATWIVFVEFGERSGNEHDEVLQTKDVCELEDPPHAIEEPEASGLTRLPESAAVGMWDAEEGYLKRLCRLRDRKVLDAAGFLLHESEDELLGAED